MAKNTLLLKWACAAISIIICITSASNEVVNRAGETETCDCAVTQSLMSTVERLQKQVSRLTKVTGNLTSQLHHVEGRISDRFLTPEVHFTVLLPPNVVNIGTSDGPIKFDVVTDNVGNAYHPLTGVFTAPYSGVYVFYVQMMKNANRNAYLHYAIDKAGTILCKNSLNAVIEYETTSCFAPAHVRKGEMVYVRRVSGDTLLTGGPWCAFSGVLISADTA